MDQKTTLYTKTQCVQCDATKRALDRQGVEYDTINLDEDDKAYAYVTSMGFRQVPVVVTPTGERWSGFRPDLIAAIK